MPHSAPEIRSSHTRHANVRMQQRSIPPAAVDVLLGFANPVRVRGHADRYEFDKRSWKRAKAYLGNDVARSFERYRDLYAIVADGRVITVAWRY
jgi:hypothetical protein